jgi:hypothetical protein
MADPTGGRLTRRQLLKGAGAVGALSAAGAVAAVEVLGSRHHGLPRIRSFAVEASGPVRAFRSRPDLRPPRVSATPGGSLGDRDSSRLLFLGPGPVALSGSQQYGPLIVDSQGEPVWFRPLEAGLEVTNFSASSYRGEPVLIWWEGKVLTTGYGQGEAVIVDRTYREVTRVRAANGHTMDMHALWLTPEGTALFTCYPRVVPIDLSSIGGPRRGHVLESIIQELDIASGQVVFEWASLPHVSVAESYRSLWAPYDYLHVNSVSPMADGTLLVSARHTWSLYKLDRQTGNIIWRVGGKRSDFRMGRGAQFAWQHDAQEVSGQTLTVFDNGTNGPIKTENQSRGLALDVDESRKVVGLRVAYTNRRPLLATAMGSVQTLPSGRVVVGWGTAARTTAFSAGGAPLLDAGLPAGMYSYRGLWLDWDSAPHHRPAVRASRDPKSGIGVMYASWNGATEMTDWRLDTGPSPDRLKPVGVARRLGFETAIPLERGSRFGSVTALDASGHELARSRTIQL